MLPCHMLSSHSPSPFFSSRCAPSASAFSFLPSPCFRNSRVFQLASLSSVLSANSFRFRTYKKTGEGAPFTLSPGQGASRLCATRRNVRNFNLFTCLPHNSRTPPGWWAPSQPSEAEASLRCQWVRAKKVLLRLPPPYQLGARSIDQNFARTRSRVVVGSLTHSVGPSDPNREKIPRLNFAERPIAQQTIACFADRADNVHPLCCFLFVASFPRNPCNGMDRAIERGPQQIVHRRIDDDKRFSSIALCIDH